MNPLEEAERLVKQDDFLGAICIYEELLEPAGEMMAGVLHNLVPLYLKARRPSLALRAAQALVYFSPKSTDAWMALSQMRERLGDWEGALQALHQVIDLDPMHEGAHQSRLFLLSSHAPAHDVRRYHEDWMDALLGHTYQDYQGQVDTDPHRRLRIGYVSGDFRKHVMDRVILPMLRYATAAEFEVFCYDTVDRPDHITADMRDCPVQWRILKGLSDEAACALIKADGIDILVDMSGITYGQRLKLFAMRPAPIQITATGYLPTTGARCFDWKLCDTTAGPAHEYTEPMWHLPNALCPSPLPGAPAVTPLPALRNGYITFGCVNSYAKVTSAAIEAWTEILQRVPTARLVMVVAGCQEQETAISVLRRFGPVQDRVLLTEWQTGSNFPTVFADLDIALNTHPYGGCMTSFDTLWQGTPIVCMEGDRAVGRYAARFMHLLDESDYVAKDWRGYIWAAVTAANNPAQLDHFRKTVRSRIQTNPAFNVPAWVFQLEDAYRGMWQACFVKGNWSMSEADRTGADRRRAPPLQSAAARRKATPLARATVRSTGERLFGETNVT